MNKHVSSILNQINDDWAFSLEDKDNTAEVKNWYDTGPYILNLQISGDMFKGLAGNRITALAGETSCGKTLFAMDFCKYFARSFPDGIIQYTDSESSIEKDYFRNRGIKLNNVVFSEKFTIESYRTFAAQFLDAYMQIPEIDRVPAMMVLDSFGGLSSEKEVRDIKSGHDAVDMTRAKMAKGMFRALQGELAKASVPLIVTNHIYESMNPFKPGPKMGGGEALKYHASITLFITKKKDKDNPDGGNILAIRAEKARLSREGTVVEVKLDREEGIDRYYGILELMNKYEDGIIKRVGNKYEFPDGTKHFAKSIYNNPEKYFTTDILKGINEKVAPAFTHGSKINLSGVTSEE